MGLVGSHAKIQVAVAGTGYDDYRWQRQVTENMSVDLQLVRRAERGVRLLVARFQF
jgi:hypothetical protein